MASSVSAAGWGRYRPAFDRLLFVIALLGVLVTVHLRIQEGRGFDQGCWGFNPDDAASAATFDCEAVTGSNVGKLFGLPNSLLGLLFYLTVAALSAAAAFTTAGATSVLKRLRAALIVGGFGFSLYLVYAQHFIIGELCALCLTSAGIATTLFIVQAVAWRSRKGSRTNFAPRREAVFFGMLVLLVAGIAVTDVIYFQGLPGAGGLAEAAADAPFGAQGEAVATDWADGLFTGTCRFDPDRSPAPGWSDLVSFTDATRGASAADVTLVEYFDPNCPACRSTLPVLEELIARYGAQVRFVFKPFPLRAGEPGWLRQVEALYAAGQEGRFFEMMEAQYDRQDRASSAGLPEADLRAAAVDAGMEPDVLFQRIESGLYRSHALRERDRAVAAGLTGVPMILIDGMVVARETPRTADCLGQLLDAALARPGT